MSRRAFDAALSAILLGGLAVRVGYVLTQRHIDPQFARPMLDGAVYLDWARDWAGGKPGPAGAYYQAPLYPFVLAAAIRAFGDNFAALYVAQHAAVVASAGLLALFARRAAGEPAALAVAALVLLYHPILFFASRPLGEPVALLALSTALFLAGFATRRSAFLAGLAAGVSALARPNLLLVPAVWFVPLSRRGPRGGAGLLMLGVAIALLPVLVRNSAASGHLVGVSTNGGLTLYHGNGPGAMGVYTPAQGLSGNPVSQRDEATSVAGARSGRPLDPVEADRWWGRQAVAVRLADLPGTAWLVVKRIGLVLDNYEHSLDYAPRLDENSWRRTAPLGFAGLLGLAAAGVRLLGFRGTGGWPVWGAIVAAVATPLAFYVSSRYRLPLAALLAVPAGAGAAALCGAGAVKIAARRLEALGIGAACALVSLSIPSAALARSEEAVSLANRAVTHQLNGDLASAERDARRSMARDPSFVGARFALGVILEARGRVSEAEGAYRRALAIDPVHAEAAGNLAKLLILKGAPEEAIPLLRRALAAWPGNEVCWTNLVLAFVAAGDQRAAHDAAEEAGRLGVVLDPQVIETIGRMNE